MGKYKISELTDGRVSDIIIDSFGQHNSSFNRHSRGIKLNNTDIDYNLTEFSLAEIAAQEKPGESFEDKDYWDIDELAQMNNNRNKGVKVISKKPQI